MRLLDDITDSMDMGLGRLRELVVDREAWSAVAHGVTKSWTQLSDWTELNLLPPPHFSCPTANTQFSLLPISLINAFTYLIDFHCFVLLGNYFNLKY